MLVKDVEPITSVGVDLIEQEDFERVVEEVIELPLQRACKIFAQKGIRTVMSSANKNNVLKKGEKPVEKEDIDERNLDWSPQRPSFEEAGKGYAWIMIDYDALSDENKDWLFDLEARRGENSGKEAIWFVQPFQRSSVEYNLMIGKYDYEYIKQVWSEDVMPPPQGIEIDHRLAEFERRHTILGYNSRNISNGNCCAKNASR